MSALYRRLSPAIWAMAFLLVGLAPAMAQQSAPRADNPPKSTGAPAGRSSSVRFTSPEAALEQGLAAYRSGFYALAEQALSFAAERGSLPGRYHLGQLYADPGGPLTNHNKAYKLFGSIVEEYADRIDVDDDPGARYVGKALTALAAYAQRGIPEIGLRPDPGRAAEYYLQAATFFRDPDAQFELAKLYLTGTGVEVDTRRAIAYLTTLSQSGHAGAQAFLADLFWRGKEVARDVNRALALITLAFENALPQDRIWIEDIYQSIYCGMAAGVRQQADGLIASFRQLYGARPASAPEASADLGPPPARTCADGSLLPSRPGTRAPAGSAERSINPPVGMPRGVAPDASPPTEAPVASGSASGALASPGAVASTGRDPITPAPTPPALAEATNSRPPSTRGVTPLPPASRGATPVAPPAPSASEAERQRLAAQQAEEDRKAVEATRAAEEASRLAGGQATAASPDAQRRRAEELAAAATRQFDAALDAAERPTEPEPKMVEPVASAAPQQAPATVASADVAAQNLRSTPTTDNPTPAPAASTPPPPSQATALAPPLSLADLARLVPPWSPWALGALLLALFATVHRTRALLVLGAVPLLAGLAVHGMAERASRTLIPATRAPPTHLAVSPDGRFVALADIRGRVLIRDTQGIVEDHKVEHGANPVRAIGFYREAPMLPLKFATVVEGVETGVDYAMVERAASPMTPTANFWREVVVTQRGVIAVPGETVRASVLSNGTIAAVACGQACVFAALARPTPDVPARGLPGQMGVATRTPLRGRPTAFLASDGTAAATRFGFGDGMIERGLSSPGLQLPAAATVMAVGTRDSFALLSDGSLALISERRVLRAECPGCSMIVAAPDGHAALAAGGRAARLIRLSELSDAGALTDVDARAWFTNSVIGLPHPIEVTAIAISGQIAATGGADGLVRLWDAGNGRLLGLIRGHRDAIAHIALSEDGGVLATVSLDGEVRVADVAGVRVATIVDPLAVYEAAARTDWKAVVPENARRLLARGGI